MNNSKKIVKAFAFAHRAHNGQKRDDGAPYISHPVRVLKILIDEFGVSDDDTLYSALLHDVVEDTRIPYEEIKAKFGKRVAITVKLLTKTGLTKEMYYGSLALASRDVQLIKCADRLDNIRDMKTWKENRKERYLEETRKYILPIARNLGAPVYGKLMEAMKNAR